MTDYPALLAAVIAKPEEDMPRLALADWFQENGHSVKCGRCHGDGWVYFGGIDGIPQEKRDCPAQLCKDGLIPDKSLARAEFIRCQVELARGFQCENPSGSTPCYARGMDIALCPSCERYTSFRRREPILMTYRRQWDIEPPFGETVHVRPNEYRRGFVSSVVATWKGWSEHADAIRKAHPIEKVTLTTWPHELEIPGVEWADDRGVIHALANRWPRITFDLPPVFDEARLRRDERGRFIERFIQEGRHGALRPR